jgi:hypothetical protein
MGRITAATAATAGQLNGDAVASHGGGGGECVRVHWYTMSKRSGNEWPGQGGGGGECVRVHRYTVSKH